MIYFTVLKIKLPRCWFEHHSSKTSRGVDV